MQSRFLWCETKKLSPQSCDQKPCRCPTTRAHAEHQRKSEDSIPVPATGCAGELIVAVVDDPQANPTVFSHLCFAKARRRKELQAIAHGFEPRSQAAKEALFQNPTSKFRCGSSQENDPSFPVVASGISFKGMPGAQNLAYWFVHFGCWFVRAMAAIWALPAAVSSPGANNPYAGTSLP
jgi:hypothetical protein